MNLLRFHQIVEPDVIGPTDGLSIRVEITDRGACFAECVPQIPPTGAEAAGIVLVVVAGAVLVGVGALLMWARSRWFRTARVE